MKVIELLLTSPCDLDWNDPLTINLEKALICKYGLPRKFKERGPPGPEEGGPRKWRGQKWRDDSKRWGNRGGRDKAYRTWLHGGGKERGEPMPPRRKTKSQAENEEAWQRSRRDELDVVGADAWEKWHDPYKPG